MNYPSILNTDVNGKTLVLRADLNSTIIEGRIMVSSRIREHAAAIELLSSKGAKVVVLSHQGRKDEDDFTSLSKHANKIRKLIQKEVSFASWKEDFVAAIKSMKSGDILVLDNTRFKEQEIKEASPKEHSKLKFIQDIASVSDYFVQDALSICHRSHATVVGFAPLLPCFAGPNLEKEVMALEKVTKSKGNKLLILGGGKPGDSIKIMKHLLEKDLVTEVILGGVVGELFLKAKGISFGEKDKFLEEKGHLSLLPDAKEILSKFQEKINLPLDFAVEGKDGHRQELSLSDFPSKSVPLDIGSKTIELFTSKISSSNYCIFNGPMGVYEKPNFCIGTQKVLEQIAFSNTFSVLGGGDTERALNVFGLLKDDFSHVSLAGKALLQFLSGKTLPGLEILKSIEEISDKD